MRPNVRTGAVAWVGYSRLQTAEVEASEMYHKGTLGVRYALATNVWMISSARAEKRAMFTPAGDARNKLIALSREEMTKAQSAAKEYEATYHDDADRQQWEATLAEANSVIAKRQEVLALLERGADEEAKALGATMTDAIAAMNDQGRGFGVVADEVRQLAERVANATKEIAGLIQGVQTGVNSTVSAMAQGTQEMTVGTAAAAEAGQALERVLDGSRQLSNQITQITGAAAGMRTSGEAMARRIEDIRGVVEQNSRATPEMEATASSVADSVGSIAAVAKENSTATEQVSASTEEMAASAEEMPASAATLRRQVSDDSAASVELGTMAENLTQQVAAFRLRGAAASAAPTPIGKKPAPSKVRVASYGWDEDEAQAA